MSEMWQSETAEALAILGNIQTAHDVGPRLTCSEVEALAVILRALGAPEAAARWLDGHAVDDEVDELHYERGQQLITGS
ncbi:hypothetical protein ACFOYW_17030 [Gryllotalpicola reticulitermitis]|uniref:Uncharacterized protein n=1 Tax=Gryllotalpicola reticulitermitis TaxID=1184153 RepID=A0ABV8QB29_9MICO